MKSNKHHPLFTPQEAVQLMAPFEVVDNRDSSVRAFPLEFRAVCIELIEHYQELHSIVSDFGGGNTNPVYEIHQLLKYALESKQFVNQHSINSILETTTFLYSLKCIEERVAYIERRADEAWQYVQQEAEKEVNHGE